MIKNITVVLFILTACLPAFAQEIKTKVTESGFTVKPDAVKEEAFDESRVLVTAGVGLGVRSGNFMTGFITSTTNATPNYLYPSTDYKYPHRYGFCVELGLRYFPESMNGFGLGFRGNGFLRKSDFQEVFSIPTQQTTNNAVARTQIFDGMGEVIYRRFLQPEKNSFVYGCLGVGYSYILQEQAYRYDRKTELSTGFFAIRPSAGFNTELADYICLYTEAGYTFSQGSITTGTLSLSRFQLMAGVQFRLNPY